MANNILSAELLGKSKEAKGEAAKTSTKGEIKSTPSLFDSLLKKSQQSVDQNASSEVKNIQSSTSETKTETKKPLSLFDRMNAKIEVTAISDVKTTLTQNIKGSDTVKETAKDVNPNSIEKSKPVISSANTSVNKKSQEIVPQETSKSSIKEEIKKETIDRQKPQVTSQKNPEMQEAKGTNTSVDLAVGKKEPVKESSLFDSLKKSVQEKTPSETTKEHVKSSDLDIKVTEIKKESKKITETKDEGTKEDVTQKYDEKDLKIEVVQKDTKVTTKQEISKETTLAKDLGQAVKQEIKTQELVITSQKITEDAKPLKIEEQKGDNLLDKIVASIQKAQESEKIDEVEFRVRNNDLDAAVAKKGQFYTESVKDLNPKDLILMKQYMQEQQHQKDLSVESALTSAKKVLMQNGNEEGMKKAAQILELNPAEITKEEIAGTGDKPLKFEPKVESFSKGVQSLLQRAYLKEETQIQSDEMIQEKVVAKKSEEVKETLKTESTDKSKEIKNVELRVERNAVEAFTSKVIDSKQRLNSFMSDMARQMYENYKPPITAFRINLNPANLGSISILIKNNKSENSLNISMNMSKGETFETMSENKTQLQNNISRLFPSSSSGEIALEFGMSDDSDGSGFASQYTQEKQQMIDSGELDENFENEVTVDTEDYM